MHREVAYVSTPAAFKERLHMAAADLALSEGAPSALIAHHLQAAGRRDEVVPYLLKDGKRALSSLDDRLAAELFSRVLQLVPKPPKTFEGSRKCWREATIGLAHALDDGGDFTGARRVLKRAAAAAIRAGWLEERTHCEEALHGLRGTQELKF